MTITLNITREFTVEVGSIGCEDDYDTDVLMEIAVEDGEAYFIGAIADGEIVQPHTQLWIKCEEWVDDEQSYLLDQAGIELWCAKGSAAVERRI
ncbi:hypothetical protein CU669_15195 [Paramagnetospirillum kuznetsovii]|uniref:Uncharacterized protein n=1 Tax=Paramagnetospirillum kuznetsovii TaxID=2053833 RepID=A0A364NW01_9PROT|nr:hypothetical protein [Paramagnetospirillum kuznetsovii]RAU21097.1 hypothetical protein CU669_15195 [Paramagnetospirillum kuznetsovii]